jgi:Flp pilus assembly pilin Flp
MLRDGRLRRGASRRFRRQRGQAMVEYALALGTISMAFVIGAQMMSGLWEKQLSNLALAMSADPIKSSF